MEAKVRNFGLTGKVRDWDQSDIENRALMVFLDDEAVKNIAVPVDGSGRQCKVRIQLRNKSIIVLEPNRRELLSALSLLDVRLDRECRPGYDPMLAFLRALESYGLPRLNFYGQVYVRPLWRLETEGNAEAVDVPESLVGDSYLLRWDSLVEGYTDGSLWTDRAGTDQFLQLAIRDKQAVKILPLGAHIRGDCCICSQVYQDHQGLLIGDRWGAETSLDAHRWRDVQMIGKSTKLIGTPAKPPEDHTPALDAE